MHTTRSLALLIIALAAVVSIGCVQLAFAEEPDQNPGIQATQTVDDAQHGFFEPHYERYGGQPQAADDVHLDTQANADRAGAKKAIVAGIEKLKARISLDGYNIPLSDVMGLYDEVIDSNPQLFYVTGGAEYGFDSNGYYISPDYAYDLKSIPVMRKKYDAALKDLLTWVPAGASSVNKVKAVHDWLYFNCEYNEEAAYLGPEEYGDHSPWNAYGALVNHDPVCQGYSYAFMAAMNELGFEATYVHDREHGWNRICIGGKWYNIDVTFDDPVMPESNWYSKDDFDPFTTYFLKSDQWFITDAQGGTHSWWTPEGVPATDTKYDEKMDWPVYRGPANNPWNGSSTPTPTPTPTPAPTPTPTPTPTSSATISRLWDQTALGTMEKIVNAGSFAKGGTVMVATSADYYDALTAAGYAGLANAPVLLTSPKSLSAETKSQISKLSPKRIVICGGAAAVSANVEKQLKAAAPLATVERAWGNDAIATANDIARKAVKATNKPFKGAAFVATPNGYWDALAAAPVAYALGYPVFLANFNGSLGSSTLKTMKDLGIKTVYIAGGNAALPSTVEKQIRNNGMSVGGRFAGKNACDTSQQIAAFGISKGLKANRMSVATRDGYWDALCGAALCGHNKSVLVLAASNDLTAINGFVKKNAGSIKTAYIFGGTSAVPKSVENALRSALGSVGTQSDAAESVAAPDLSLRAA